MFDQQRNHTAVCSCVLWTRNNVLLLISMMIKFKVCMVYIVYKYTKCYNIHMSMVSCQKGPTRHAYAWQIGPFWQDTLDIGCWKLLCHGKIPYCVSPLFGYYGLRSLFNISNIRSRMPCLGPFADTAPEMKDILETKENCSHFTKCSIIWIWHFILTNATMMRYIVQWDQFSYYCLIKSRVIL